MEIYLLATIPRKKKYKGLRFVIKPLPTLLPADLMAGTLGMTFWEPQLCLLKPTPHSGRISRENFAVFIDQPKNIDRWGGSPEHYQDEFMEALGYRWKVHSRTQESGISQMCDEQEEPIVRTSAGSSSFQFGKGTMMESVPLEGSFRQHLDNLLIVHPEVCSTDFVIQWHESTNMLEVTMSGASLPQSSWVLDLRYQELVGGLTAEDWVGHRIMRLASHSSIRLNEYSELIQDFHRAIKEKYYITLNLIGYFDGGQPSPQSKLSARNALSDLTEWVTMFQIFVAEPLVEIINRERHKPLKLAFLDETTDYWGIRVIRSEIDFNNSFHLLVLQTLQAMKSILRKRKSNDTSIDYEEEQILNENRLDSYVSQFQPLLAVIVKNKVASRVVRSKLSKIAQSIVTLQPTQFRKPFNIAVLGSLHSALTEFVKGPLRARLAGFGRQLFTSNVDRSMQPVQGLEEFDVLLATRSNSNRLLLLTKSKEDRLSLSFVEVLDQDNIVRHEIPREMAFLPDDCLTTQSVANNSFWVIHEPRGSITRELSILRIGWQESGETLAVQFAYRSWQNGGNSNFSPYAVFEDCVLIPYRQPRRDNSQFMTLKVLKTVPFGDQLTEMVPLANVTFGGYIRELNQIMAEEKRYCTGIHRATKVSQFVSFGFVSLGGKGGQDHVIALSLFDWNLGRQEFQILNFGFWRINVGFSLWDRGRSRYLTFKIKCKEYFLCLTSESRILINFDCRNMSLVSVSGSHLHRLPQELGPPVREFGTKHPFPEWIYCQKLPEITSAMPRFSLVRLKYVPY